MSVVLVLVAGIPLFFQVIRIYRVYLYFWVLFEAILHIFLLLLRLLFALQWSLCLRRYFLRLNIFLRFFELIHVLIGLVFDGNSLVLMRVRNIIGRSRCDLIRQIRLLQRSLLFIFNNFDYAFNETPSASVRIDTVLAQLSRTKRSPCVNNSQSLVNIGWSISASYDFTQSIGFESIDEEAESCRSTTYD